MIDELEQTVRDNVPLDLIERLEHAVLSGDSVTEMHRRLFTFISQYDDCVDAQFLLLTHVDWMVRGAWESRDKLHRISRHAEARKKWTTGWLGRMRRDFIKNMH